MGENQQKVLVCDNLRKEYFSASSEKIIALNDISFDLTHGEIMGVIGRNGSGKSTLLKVLSKITGVTDGSVSYEGKLTSIIEIGTGFHPDLTGNENIQMSKQLLGFKTDKSDVYKNIVEFSGLEDFMDMPVKHYSSGMYLRLAFSIAFHSKIDILLLDEVLAVGDADFRRKCYNKIRELKDFGASIILVSHQMEPIIEFCDRCMWMDNGNIVQIGAPLDVIENYMESTQLKSIKIRGEREETDKERIVDLSVLDNPYVKVSEIKINGKGKDPEDTILISDVIQICLSCEKLVDSESIEFVFTISNFNNIRVLTDSYALREVYSPQLEPKGSYQIICEIPGQLLNRGVYDLGIMICKNAKNFISEGHQLSRFKIAANENLGFDVQISTVIKPHLNWEVQLLSE